MLDQLSQLKIKQPLILKDFLPINICNEICQWAEQSERWEPSTDPWDQRCINLQSQDDHIRSMMREIHNETKQKLYEYWNPGTEQYADIFGIVRWRPGDKLEPPHADAENENGSPHPFPYREYAAIIYLNETYTGGQIYFPKFNLVPKITKGTLAIFPGTVAYLHGVTPVTAGMRYTVAAFFTSQKQYGTQYLF